MQILHIMSARVFLENKEKIKMASEIFTQPA